MQTKRIVTWSVAALFLLGLAALPAARSQEKSKPAPHSAQQGCSDDSAVWKIPSRAEMDRMQAELRAQLATLESERSQLQAEIGPEIQNEMMGAQAELRAQLAALQKRSRQILERAPQVFEDDEESGWLGIEINEVTAEKAKELNLSPVRGVLVASVDEDSPASKAGLKENDVIIGFEQQNVEGAVQFRRLVRETPPGRSVSLSVWRDGAAQTVSIEVGNRSNVLERQMVFPNGEVSIPHAFDFNFNSPGAFYMFDRSPRLGISAEDLNGQLGEFFGAPGGEGVLVREVMKGTPAEKAGLKAGDVITKVNSTDVHNLEQLMERLEPKGDAKSVTLGILRHGSAMNLTVTLEQPKPREREKVSRRMTL